MTIDNRIRNWNVDRCIPQEFNKGKEAGMLAEELSELLMANTEHDVLDALCDIVVLAKGAMWKLGYDSEVAMDQTLMEIEDRGGYYDVDIGKWLKQPNPDAYKADYWNAVLK